MQNNGWILFALLGAVATALTALFSKVGLEKVDANIGMAIQAVIIVVLTWVVVAVQGGFGGEGFGQIAEISKKAWLFLALSGVSTTVAYLFYFRAVKLGDVSRAAPVDRISLIFSIMLAAWFLKEKVTPLLIAGAVLMTAGAIMIAFSGQK